MEARKNINDRRSVKLENIFSHNYIPLFGGRPKRDSEISKDDIINLKIALNNSKTFEEFINKV